MRCPATRPYTCTTYFGTVAVAGFHQQRQSEIHIHCGHCGRQRLRNADLCRCRDFGLGEISFSLF